MAATTRPPGVIVPRRTTITSGSWGDVTGICTHRGTNASATLLLLAFFLGLAQSLLGLAPRFPGGIELLLGVGHFLVRHLQRCPGGLDGGRYLRSHAHGRQLA